MADASALERVLRYLGLAAAPGGRPLRSGRGPSRYAVGTSVTQRLDEDVDDLRARLDALERRLDGR